MVEASRSSPAAEAGIRAGDVIVKLDRSVVNRFDVERALWSYKPGDAVEATVVRNGKETQVEITLSRSGVVPVPAVRHEGKERNRREGRPARPVEDNR